MVRSSFSVITQAESVHRNKADETVRNSQPIFEYRTPTSHTGLVGIGPGSRRQRPPPSGKACTVQMPARSALSSREERSGRDLNPRSEAPEAPALSGLRYRPYTVEVRFDPGISVDMIPRRLQR